MKTLQKIDDFFLPIERIIIAHEFTYDLTSVYKCPDGRNSYGLVYIASGQLDYSFYDGREISVRTGDVLLLKPNDAYKVSCSKTCFHYTVNFTVAKPVEGEDLNRLLSCENPILKNYKIESRDKELFVGVCAAWAQKNAGYRMTALSLLYKLLTNVIKRQNDCEEENTIVSVAKKFIEEKWSEKFTVEDLSELCKLSQTHFRHLFSSVYKISPIQYRDSIRLLNAKDMLLQNEFTVSEIAYKCGFDDPNYFSRFFKKHTDYSPSEFAEKYI